MKHDASKFVPIFKGLGQNAQNLAMGLPCKLKWACLANSTRKHEYNNNDSKLNYDASKFVPVSKSLGQNTQNLAMGLHCKFNNWACPAQSNKETRVE